MSLPTSKDSLYLGLRCGYLQRDVRQAWQQGQQQAEVPPGAARGLMHPRRRLTNAPSFPFFSKRRAFALATSWQTHGGHCLSPSQHQPPLPAAKPPKIHGETCTACPPPQLHPQPCCLSSHCLLSPSPAPAALLPRFPHPPSPRQVCNYVGGPRVCSRNSSILMKSVFSSLLNSRKGGLVPGAKSFSSSGFLEQRK